MWRNTSGPPTLDEIKSAAILAFEADDTIEATLVHISHPEILAVLDLVPPGFDPEMQARQFINRLLCEAGFSLPLIYSDIQFGDDGVIRAHCPGNLSALSEMEISRRKDIIAKGLSTLPKNVDYYSDKYDVTYIDVNPSQITFKPGSIAVIAAATVKIVPWIVADRIVKLAHSKNQSAFELLFGEKINAQEFSANLPLGISIKSTPVVNLRNPKQQQQPGFESDPNPSSVAYDPSSTEQPKASPKSSLHVNSKSAKFKFTRNKKNWRVKVPERERIPKFSRIVDTNH